MKKVLRALKTQHIDLDRYSNTRCGYTLYTCFLPLTIPLTFFWHIKANISARTLLWAHWGRKMLLLPKLLRSFGLGQRGPYLILCLESPKKVGFSPYRHFWTQRSGGTLYPQHGSCGPPEKPSDPLLTLVMAYT